MRMKRTRWSLLSVKQLNYHNNTYQGRFLVGRRTDYRTLSGSKTRWPSNYAQIKPIQSNERSLQLNWGLLNVLFNFAKQSYLQSTFRLWRTVLYSEKCIYEWNAIQKIDITNKCSTMCVCRIVLQKFYINIKKSNYNIDISNVSDLPFDGMYFFI